MANVVPRRLFPHGRAIHEASGMLCRMSPVLQHEAPELALSDGSTHGLPRPMKLSEIAPQNDPFGEDFIAST